MTLTGYLCDHCIPCNRCPIRTSCAILKEKEKMTQYQPPAPNQKDKEKPNG